MINLRKVEEANVFGKNVLLRADLDVPIVNGSIADDLRLKRSLPTINYLLSKNAKVFIIGHLGRPEGNNPNFSLAPVANWYADNFKLPVLNYESNGLPGWRIGEQIIILENLRFDKGEESNDPSFAAKLASFGEIYVNDAFASSHRAHASVVGIAVLLPSFAGLELIKEVETLTAVSQNPKRPLAVVIGGAKIETKLPLVEKMHRIADFVLVAGEIAEKDKVLMKVAHEEIEGVGSQLIAAELTEDKTDITQESLEYFIGILKKSASLIWNGPLGLIEKDIDENTSTKFAKAVVELGIYSVVGGGDTVSVIEKMGLTDKFSFVSTGGGAMLEFLSGEALPGLKVLLR